MLRSTELTRIKFSALALSLVAGLSACSSTKVSDESAADLTSVSDAPVETSSEPFVDSNEMKNDSAMTAYRGSRRPVVESAPFQADGRWMNSYYFVRGESETWESISNLLYGRPDRAEMLRGWNKNRGLASGTLVYYSSNLRPDDSAKMKILAEDFGIPLQTLQVRPGDSLSAIAQRLYGSFGGWKEISALNPQLSSPDLIEVGNILNMQPAQLDTQSILAQKSVELAQDQSGAANLSQAPPVTEQAAEVPVEASVDQNTQDAQKPGLLARLKMGSGLIRTLGIGLILASLIFFVTRRRKNNGDDANLGWNSDATNITQMPRTKP